MNGNQDFAIGPSVVGGGVGEVNTFWKEGVTTTLGWGVGSGTLPPTLNGEDISFGKATAD